VACYGATRPIRRTGGQHERDHAPISAAAVADAGCLDVLGELRAGGRSTALELHVPVRVVDDRLELGAEAVLDARQLGISWSPVGSLRTPVTLTIRARLRRVS